MTLPLSGLPIFLAGMHHHGTVLQKSSCDSTLRPDRPQVPIHSTLSIL
jgi:hypothetical protein